MVLVLLGLAGLARSQEEVPWQEVMDAEGRFTIHAPPGWAAEPWEEGTRRGTKARPPEGDPMFGALFGVEYQTDPRAAEVLDPEGLAERYRELYAGQGGELVSGPGPSTVDALPAVEERFRIAVEREHEGKPVSFTLEYRVFFVEKGDRLYVVQIAAESRILEGNADLVARLLEGVHLTP